MPRTSKGAWRHTELEILRAIKELHSATAYDIAKKLDLHTKWVAHKCVYLREQKRIYVSGFQKMKLIGPPRLLFSIRDDEQEDEVYTEAKTGSQRSMEYIRRLRYKQFLLKPIEGECYS